MFLYLKAYIHGASICKQVVQVPYSFVSRITTDDDSQLQEIFNKTQRGWVEDLLLSWDVLSDRRPVGDFLMFFCSRSQRTRGVKRSLFIRTVNKKTCMQKLASG